MAAVNTTEKIPLPLNLSDSLHQGENWKSFGREWNFYELAAGIHKKAQEVRVGLLLNVIGKEEMDMDETFIWGNDSDVLKIDKVLETFEESWVPVLNEICERCVFFKREQLPNESLDNYIINCIDEALGVVWFWRATQIARSRPAVRSVQANLKMQTFIWLHKK